MAVNKILNPGVKKGLGYKQNYSKVDNGFYINNSRNTFYTINYAYL